MAYKEERKTKPKVKKKRTGNQFGYRATTSYADDEYVPKGRKNVRPKAEKGMVITYPDMVKGCPGININTRKGKSKCIKKLKADYRKEHEVLYTTECSGIRNPIARRRCIKKYNRGL